MLKKASIYAGCKHFKKFLMAYKSLEDIIGVIKESVDILDIMKPVYNFKASYSALPWKKEKQDGGID